MPTIELTEDEHALTRELLARALNQLLHEINHTDDRELREALRQRRYKLETVLRKLSNGRRVAMAS